MIILRSLSVMPRMASSIFTPRRIMSLKLCTDALLMDLVPPERIASISYLSREQAALRLWPQAARIPVNHEQNCRLPELRGFRQQS